MRLPIYGQLATPCTIASVSCNILATTGTETWYWQTRTFIISTSAGVTGLTSSFTSWATEWKFCRWVSINNIVQQVVGKQQLLRRGHNHAHFPLTFTSVFFYILTLIIQAISLVQSHDVLEDRRTELHYTNFVLIFPSKRRQCMKIPQHSCLNRMVK
jgi:hypothetical protein